MYRKLSGFQVKVSSGCRKENVIIPIEYGLLSVLFHKHHNTDMLYILHYMIYSHCHFNTSCLKTTKIRIPLQIHHFVIDLLSNYHNKD